MAKKKSGVDISGLTSEQLSVLITEAQSVIADVKKSEASSNKKALKKSGEWDALKDKWANLNKATKKLCKSFSFDLSLPIHFVVKVEAKDDSDWTYYEDSDLEKTFKISVTGTVPNEGHNLTKKQRALLQQQVKEYVDNACGAIHALFPEGSLDAVEAQAKEVQAFIKSLESQSLATKDLK